MKAYIYGTITKPVVMVVGTWDPLVSDYNILIDHMNNYCQNKNLELLIVTLDPSPHNLLRRTVFPTYGSSDIRIKLLKRKSCGGVAKFSMEENELGDGVEDFMNVFLKQNIQVAELWLYHGQTMGRGGKSNITAVRRSCMKMGIEVNKIPEELNFKDLASNAKKYLTEGDVHEAAKIVGDWPLWKRQENSAVPIGWKSGVYEYYSATLSADHKVHLQTQRGTLGVYTNDKGINVFDWPDKTLEGISITNYIA